MIIIGEMRFHDWKYVSDDLYKRECHTLKRFLGSLWVERGNRDHKYVWTIIVSLDLEGSIIDGILPSETFPTKEEAQQAADQLLVRMQKMIAFV